MTSTPVKLSEHIGPSPGISVQIADRPFDDPEFRSVVLEEPQFEALEPLLRAAYPPLHVAWRHGVTTLPPEAAARLAAALLEISHGDESLKQLFLLLGHWIKERINEGRSIYVLGY